MIPSSCISISTCGLPAGQQSEHWLQKVNSHIIELDAHNAPRAAIEATLKQYDLGEVKLNHINSTAHGVQRSCTNISHDSREKVMLSLLLSGGGYACQGLNGGQQRVGDAVIYTSDYPYALAFPEAVDMLVITLPRQLLAAEIGKWEQTDLIRLDQHLRIGDFSTQKFYQHVTDYYSGQCSAQATVEGFLKNLDGILNQRNSSVTSRNLQDLLMKGKHLINKYLHDEDLNIDSLSKQLHTSSRQLARAFAQEGKSVGRYIWIKRLEMCRQDILNLQDTRSLSEIAFGWGFNHPAHFSRSYKQHFGESPTQTRQANRKVN